MKAKLLYLDCPSGLAGDMLLAGLIAVGAQEQSIREGLSRLKLADWRMESYQLEKQGLLAQKIDFICEEEQDHRHLPQILSLIAGTDWPKRVKDLAAGAFGLLAKAEAAVHGCDPAQVHFHEVGAADAILDICGVALAIEELGIEQVYCGPLPFAGGFVECAHGRLPLPAPATLKLLEGYNFYDSDLKGELITPTGAALLAALGARQQKPDFTLLATGLGAGKRDLPIANAVRCILAQATTDFGQDEVDIITCNLDDSSGEELGRLIELLLEAGALDVAYCPLYMKKSRPGWQLQVIAPPSISRLLAELIFRESSGIGLRLRRESRLLQPRRQQTVTSPYGDITLKISGNNIAPEYEDVARLARKSGRPFKEIYRLALCLADLEENK